MLRKRCHFTSLRFGRKKSERMLTTNLSHYQETYSTFPYSMMTIFVMTLGELNYSDTFMPWGKLEYATLTNILFFLFVLGMPIILMNMLVSNKNTKRLISNIESTEDKGR